MLCAIHVQMLTARVLIDCHGRRKIGTYLDGFLPVLLFVLCGFESGIIKTRCGTCR